MSKRSGKHTDSQDETILYGGPIGGSMTKRYLSLRSRPLTSFYEADATDSLATTLHERDRTPRPTGLLDAHGNELC